MIPDKEDARLVILNSDMPEQFASWMSDNDIHSYGKSHGYNWVSWNGKFGNSVLSTQRLLELYLSSQK
jgi:hypothetical protein